MRKSNHRFRCLCALAALSSAVVIQAESFHYINFSAGENQDGMQSVRIDNGTSLRFGNENLTLAGPDGEVAIPYENGRLITFSSEPTSLESIAASFEDTPRIVLNNGVLTVSGVTSVKSINVFDTLGRSVASNTGAYELGVGHLSTGVYIATAYTPQGKVTAKIAIHY